MDDFYIIHESKEYLQDCWRKISGQMDSLKLELNEKTGIFPLRNGLNFLGFHTYLTETGGTVQKLRRDSAKRMKARIRKWRYDAQQGTLDRERARLSWEAWDAHAARGDTFNLRKKIAAQVSEVLGTPAPQGSRSGTGSMTRQKTSCANYIVNAGGQRNRNPRYRKASCGEILTFKGGKR